MSEQDNTTRNDDGDYVGELDDDVDFDDIRPHFVAVVDPHELEEDCAVDTSGPWGDLCKGLVGFDHLKPIKSLNSLLKGNLLPKLPEEMRLALAEAIVNELAASEGDGGDCRELMDEISERILDQEDDEETE